MLDDTVGLCISFIFSRRFLPALYVFIYHRKLACLEAIHDLTENPKVLRQLLFS